MRPNALAIFLWLLPCLAGLAVAQDETEPPLITRTKAVLGEYAKIQTKQEGEDVRRRLIAMADTLETSQQDAWASQCLERAGIIDYRFGQYEQAMEIWARGLAAARRSSDSKRIAALLNAQASGTSALGDDETALRLCNELLDLRRELGDVRGEGITWHNMAFSHLALYEYPEALDALTHAMRCHREANNGFGLAGSQLALTPLLAANGEPGEALAMADSAVAAAERINAPDILAASLDARGMQLHYMGRVDEALASFERATEIATASGSVQVAHANTVNHADALISAGRPQEALALLTNLDTDPMGNAANRAIELGIEGRALLASGDLDRAQTILEAGVLQFQAMQDTLSSAVSQAEALRAGTALAQLIRVHVRRDQPERAWQLLEDCAARTLRREIQHTPEGQPLAAVQTKLRELDAILLSYGTTDYDGTVATLATPDSVFAREIPYPRSMPDDLAALSRLMASGADDATCAPLLQRIADAFLGPWADHLAAGPSRCIIVPGGFAGLAFESLPWQGRSLGDAMAVSYAPSASVLLALESRASSTVGFLALADPTPAEGEGTTTLAMRSRALSDTPLPQARAEVQHIAPSQANVFLGRDASRQAFLERAPDAAVLHLATHALVDSSHPDHSALVLYTDDPGQPGVTAAEIEALPLRADLVSLSGCQTAGGYGTGEGHFGLTRAFLVAGARSVVSSWWDVEDSAARRFMELFYEGLGQAMARDVAAQRARAVMREEGYPYRDRAAFAVTGAVSGSLPALTATGGAKIPSWLIAAALAALVSAAVALSLRRRAA